MQRVNSNSGVDIGMTLSYCTALELVLQKAQERQLESTNRAETVPLQTACGRTANNDILSPLSTPAFDNSAMDGFAVSSFFTSTAAPESPVLLRVVGTTAAGDDPLEIPNDIGHDGSVPCVEIMTGAAFPRSLSTGREFDACIPYEHVSEVSHTCGEAMKRIAKPPTKNQNRRPAGSDFTKGKQIAPKGTLIGSRHVMAMASVGITHVEVRRKLVVAVWSIGSELSSASASTMDNSSHIFDANGPYLAAALQSLGVLVEFHGAVFDDADTLAEQLRQRLHQGSLDIIITTGGVSAGKFDFMRTAIERVGATVVFHHVAMKPGHPMLFASFGKRECCSGSTISAHHPHTRQPHDSSQETAIFGLPGNPVATAATFRFFVVPYILALQGMPREIGVAGRILPPTGSKMPYDHKGVDAHLPRVVLSNPKKNLDLFRHGTIATSKDGHLLVELGNEQSAAKIRPFLSSNCWVHIPSDHGDVRVGDVLRCFSQSVEASPC